MSLRAWRTAYGCVAGTSHARTDTPCQDAAACEVLQASDGSEVLLACVADGAGSASQSGRGARLAVDAFRREFGDAVRRQPDLGFLDEPRMGHWLATVREALRGLASESGHGIGEYACTFLGAIVGASCAVFIQIGDGAIVVDSGEPGEGRHEWVFWPQHGEFANSTFFVTMEDAGAILRYDRREAADGRPQVREFAMFTDGLERLILDMTGRTVHSPSLRPVLDWLATTEPACTGHPSGVILAYLNSANVNRRTDDDKSLVLATRAEPAGPQPLP